MRVLQKAMAFVLYASHGAAMTQAPVWIWATGLQGNGGIFMSDVCASSANGCFAYGVFGDSVFLPFDTLDSTDPNGNYFIVHVDTLGYPTWAAQFADSVVSMHGLPDDGLSCLVRYTGSTTVQGQSIDGSADGYSALLVEFDNSGAVTSMVNMPGIVVDGIGVPTMHHAGGGGIAVTADIQDSLSMLGTWVQGGGVAIARLSPLGDLLWAQPVVGHTATVGAIHIAGSGEVLTCALASIDDEPEVLSFDANGAMVWALPVSLGWGSFDPPVMARRPSGRALIATEYHSQAPIGGGTSLTVSEVDLDGDLLWETSAADPSYWGNDIRTLSVLENGDALVGGYLIGYLNFGGFSLSSGGPDGFVAAIDPTGVWQWGVTETSGNVFGTTAAPGTNTRIYTTGYTDTGAWFGSHHVPTVMGAFKGFVACLGDAFLNTPEAGTNRSGLIAWPDPTTGPMWISGPRGFSDVVRVTDMRGRSVDQLVERLGPDHFDVSRLAHGTYVMSIGDRHIRFIRE